MCNSSAKTTLHQPGIFLPFHDALQRALRGVIAGLEPKTTLDQYAECMTSLTSLSLFLFLISPVVLLAFQGTYFECFVLPNLAGGNLLPQRLNSEI